jgi:hypothetical protein
MTDHFASHLYVADEKEDYVDYLTVLGETYLKSLPSLGVLTLSTEAKIYLQGLVESIFKYNELLFKSSLKSRFYIIRDQRPFHFSLPGGRFFFSTSLIKNFLQTEDLLLSAITYEMIKSYRNIYPRKFLIPLGHLNTTEILEVTRIPQEAKMKIDKWVFLALKRANYDPYSYLAWIQIQNRNSVEFSSMLVGRDISKEEHSLKKFLVKLVSGVENNKREFGNSSRGYYQLIKEIEQNHGN